MRLTLLRTRDLALAAVRRHQSRQLLRHGPVLWSAAAPGGPFLTVVGRLPELCAELFAALDPVRCTLPDHHHYPPGDLHVTLLNLDHAGQDQSAAVRAAIAATDETPPLRLVFTELAASRETIYLPGIETTGALRRLRRRLRATTGKRSHPANLVRDDLVVVNVVRFSTPAGGDALRRVERLAPMPRLRAVLNTAEVVITDKVLSVHATKQLAVLPLRADA